jgi:hypothetical protein
MTLGWRSALGLAGIAVACFVFVIAPTALAVPLGSGETSPFGLILNARFTVDGQASGSETENGGTHQMKALTETWHAEGEALADRFEMGSWWGNPLNPPLAFVGDPAHDSMSGSQTDPICSGTFAAAPGALSSFSTPGVGTLQPDPKRSGEYLDMGALDYSPPIYQGRFTSGPCAGQEGVNAFRLFVAPNSGPEVNLDHSGAQTYTVGGALAPDGGYSGGGSWSAKVTFTVELGDYLALGDSYSSGEGNPPFRAGNCDRSSNTAYPLLLKPQLIVGDPSAPFFFACSGAKLDNVLTKAQHSDAPPQITHVNSNDGLITISIGGNDVGFAPVLKSCLMHDDCQQIKQNRQAFRDGIQRLTNRQHGVPALLSELRAKAPHALILLVLYPNFFPSGGDCHPSAGVLHHVLKIHGDDVAWLHDQIDALDTALEATTFQNGSPLPHVRTFNPGLAWVGHDVCGKHSWFTKVDLKHALSGHSAFFFHPNKQGQDALYDQVLGAVRP